MSKSLLNFLFLSILLLPSINCACQFGYFTTNSPCDTQAIPIQYKMYTSSSIQPGQWAYYYIPLGGKILFFFLKNNVFLKVLKAILHFFSKLVVLFLMDISLFNQLQLITSQQIRTFITDFMFKQMARRCLFKRKSMGSIVSITQS